MGSEATIKRHAGFVEWNPQDKTVYWMQCVQDILRAYEDYWPLTIRQIFYRLVATYEYEKTEQAYGRLINYLGRARRAKWIPFDAIRDDGAIAALPAGFADHREFMDTVLWGAASFDLFKMDFQDTRVEIFCEAAGMVPLLRNAVREYGVPVYSGGGFNSLTTVKSTADRIIGDERDMVIFNFGDYDPSGESIFESFKQDVEMFCAQETGAVQVEFERVALTEDQVDDMGIPTAPPKKTDSRSKNWDGDTAQLEAIPPDVLSQMAIDAVTSTIDLDTHQELLDREGKIRKKLIEGYDAMHAEIGDTWNA